MGEKKIKKLIIASNVEVYLQEKKSYDKIISEHFTNKDVADIFQIIYSCRIDNTFCFVAMRWLKIGNTNDDSFWFYFSKSNELIEQLCMNKVDFERYLIEYINSTKGDVVDILCRDKDFCEYLKEKMKEYNE